MLFELLAAFCTFAKHDLLVWVLVSKSLSTGNLPRLTVDLERYYRLLAESVSASNIALPQWNVDLERYYLLLEHLQQSSYTSLVS